jgi:hypothetical protein
VAAAQYLAYDVLGEACVAISTNIGLFISAFGR